MAHIITQWDNAEKTIMRVTYQKGWTWDDMMQNFAIETAMLDEAAHRVDVIAEFGNTDLPPGAIMRLPKIAVSPPYTHPNGGEVVMVASPGFIQEVVNIYKKVYGVAAKLVTVRTVEEAHALLKQKRAAAEAEAQKAAADTGKTATTST
jgi:hypothetical protein